MGNLKDPQKLFFLSIVGLISLIVGTQIITILSVNERAGEARTINLAGRQRMISQKITKLAYQYRDTGEQAILNNMRAEAENWNQVQKGLQFGSDLLGLKADLFSKDDALFEEMSSSHNVIYQTILEADYETDPQEIINVVAGSESEYLKLMDAAVFSMQEESQRNHQRTRIYKLIFFVIIMVITGAIGLIFVRPLRDKIKYGLSEEELNDHKLFKAVFNDSGIGIALVNLNGKLFRLNNFFCDLLGYSEKEMLSMTFPEFTHPDDLEKDWDLFSEMVDGRRDYYSIDKRYFHRNGEVVWVSLAVSAVYNKAEELDYVIAMVQDVTEEKKSLTEKEEKELLFQSVFNSTFSFCGVAKPDGTIIELNKPALDYMKMNPSDVKGMKLQEGPWWTGQEQRDKAQRAIDEASKGNVARFDLEVENPDGLHLIIDFSVVPVKNRSGEITMLIPEGRDITEKKKLIDETNRTKESLQEAQKIGKIGDWSWNLLTNEITWSDLNYEVFGMPKTFTPNFDTLQEIIHPEDRKSFRDDIEKAIKEKSEHDYVHRVLINEGEEIRYVHERGKIYFDKEGNPVRIAGTSQDVTNIYQKEAELKFQKEELEKALNILSATQQAAQIGSWELDLETNKVYWSDEVYRIHEIDADQEIKVEEAINYYREDFRENVQKAINSSVENKESWNLECVLITGKGNEIWVRAIGYPIFNEKDELILLRGLFLNIDESKRKTLELNATHEKLQLSVEAGQVAIWIWDLKTNELEWNNQAYKVFGIDDKNFKPTFEKFAGMIHPDDIATVQSATEETLKTGNTFDIEFRFIWPSGEVRNLSGRGDVVFDEEGNPEKMIGINLDVTERAKLVEKIKKQESQLRSFVEQAPVAVAMFDTDMKYITVSNEWYRHNHIEGEYIIGRSHYDVIPEINERNDWKEAHQKVLNGIELKNAKDKFVTKNGDNIWISWKAIPWYKGENEVGGMILFVSDVTTEVVYTEKLEEEVQERIKQIKDQAKQLEETNKELESFSYTISHDLRAPLRSINGFSDILLEDYAEVLDDEGKRLLQIVRKSGLEMGELIDDILSFSRLGRKSLNKSLFDIDLLFSNVCDEEKRNYPNHDIDVNMENLANAYGDIALIKQVVTNLISNAFKYSSHNTNIRINISSKEDGSKVVYSIADNGAGFNMEYHEKLFGVFQRLHSKNEFEGTGVGLAIVKRIINKHGGEVWAESEPEKGSVFHFSLPKK